MNAPLDPGTLQSLRLVKGSHGGPLLDQVVQLALETLPEHLAGLRQHREAGEWEGLKRVAHMLKGTSGSFGAKVLSERAKALEVAVRERDEVKAAHALREVEAEAHRVTEALRALQNA